MRTKIDGAPPAVAETETPIRHLLPPRFVYIVLNVVILASLIIYFGRFIQPTSFDLAQHFLLVDEIMKHGGVRPYPVSNLSAMALYPPASHWLAAIIGCVIGSGLIAITIVSILALYFSYLLIYVLVSIGRPTNAVLFATFFLLLVPTHSEIGWEVVSNFFYPQLVGNVVYFSLLLLVSHDLRRINQTLSIAAVGLAAMLVQPLTAVHILAFGCVLSAFNVLEAIVTTRSSVKADSIVLVAMVVSSIVIASTSPEFRLMQTIATNNGGLEFGYGHIMLVAATCGLTGVLSLWRRLSGRGHYVDAVLGCAVVAAVSLTILQFLLLKFHGDGSPYAVKKHMFLALSLGTMNVVRILGSFVEKPSIKVPTAITAPLGAVMASVIVFQSFTTPVAPIVRAMDYANKAVLSNIPGFIPGNLVDADDSQGVFTNAVISLSSFQHPFDSKVASWLVDGTPFAEGASFAMVRRTDDIDSNCGERFAEGNTYVIVRPICLNRYSLNTPINFALGGSSWRFIGSGWGATEPWGTWALGDVGGHITIDLPPGSKGPYKLTVDAGSFLPPTHPSQKVIVEVNGTTVATWVFNMSSSGGERTADIPAAIADHDEMHIVFRAPGAVSPAFLGITSDTRVFGIGVKTLTLSTEFRSR